jgi:hypothetical protein
MKFLKNLGFKDEDIKQLESETSRVLLEELIVGEELVTFNIQFLKDLGVINYQEVVLNFSYMFLMDPSNFQRIFLKYEREDLIDKIAKDVRVVEHL